jgi:hypothetical protein
MRREARTESAARQMVGQMQQKFGGMMLFDQGTLAPILVCERGAKLRRLDLGVAAADAKRWWQTGKVPLRPTPHQSVAKQVFHGKTVAEAEAEARAAIPEEDIKDITVSEKPKKKTAVRQGADAESAAMEAFRAVPDGAFDVDEEARVHPPESGEKSLKAFSKDDAQRMKNTGLPSGAKVVAFNCTVSPKSGFLGIGKAPGEWTVQWEVPVFTARVSYKSPATVTAHYYKQCESVHQEPIEAEEDVPAPLDTDECPRGHGALKEWEGSLRCWTCGWPDK